jgi:hypothetical protein
MNKIIKEVKKHKKAMIGVAVIVLIFAWMLVSGDTTPVDAQ